MLVGRYVAICAQLRIFYQQANRMIEFIEVCVRLRPVPFLEAVFPDLDKITFRQLGLADGSFHLS